MGLFDILSDFQLKSTLCQISRQWCLPSSLQLVFQPVADFCKTGFNLLLDPGNAAANVPTCCSILQFCSSCSCVTDQVGFIGWHAKHNLENQFYTFLTLQRKTLPFCIIIWINHDFYRFSLLVCRGFSTRQFPVPIVGDHCCSTIDKITIS